MDAEHPNTAVGYVRVSTSEQADSGLSLGAQRKRLCAYATAHQLDLREIYSDEGVSGKTIARRPGLAKAVEDACKHKGVLLVTSLSRLSRSTTDSIALATKLHENGAGLAALDESFDSSTPTGRFAFRLLASLGELERDLVSERTRVALDLKRSKNERISGKIPFGFQLDDDGRTLIEDPDEQTTIERMAELRAAGMGWQKIGKHLDAEGRAPKYADRWSPQTVRGVLTRESVAERVAS